MDALEKALVAVNEIMAVLKAELNRTRAAEKKANEYISEAGRQAEVIRGAAELLKQREAGIKVREDAVAAREKKASRIENITSAEQALDIAKAAFENEKKAFNAEVRKQRSVNEQLVSDIHSAQAEIRRKQDVLAEEKRNYKARMLQEIGKEAEVK